MCATQSYSRLKVLVCERNKYIRDFKLFKYILIIFCPLLDSFPSLWLFMNYFLKYPKQITISKFIHFLKTDICVSLWLFKNSKVQSQYFTLTPFWNIFYLRAPLRGALKKYFKKFRHWLNSGGGGVSISEFF